MTEPDTLLRERVEVLQSCIADLHSSAPAVPGTKKMRLATSPHVEAPAGSLPGDEKASGWRRRLQADLGLSTAPPDMTTHHPGDGLLFHSAAPSPNVPRAATPGKGQGRLPMAGGHAKRLAPSVHTATVAGPTSNSQLAASLAVELDKAKRRCAELDERSRQAEHEILLLRADKACMVRALNYTQQDNVGLHVEAEEADKIVEAVRSENAELLEMVEEQHKLLAEQQARSSRAEREVHRLHDETEIMRQALADADKNIEALMLRADLAESELAELQWELTADPSLSMPHGVPHVPAAARRLYAQASAKAKEVSQAAAALDSLVVAAVESPKPAKDRESPKEDESQTQQLVKKQQELLQQQQDLLLVLLQKRRSQWTRATWLLASLSTAAVISSVATAVVILHRRRKN